MKTTITNGVVTFASSTGSLTLRPGGDGRVDFSYEVAQVVEGHALHPALLKDVAHRVLGTNELDQTIDSHYNSLAQGTFGL